MSKPRLAGSFGFTLIELTIVIVIIGLLIGGIVAGRSIINHAKLTSAIADVVRYKDAIEDFRKSYNGLPGDLPNATTYWPSVTANGDGDGKIGYGAGSTTEPWLFWQHLGLAGIIKEQYTGLAAPTAHNPGVNVPLSALGGDFYLLWVGGASASADYYDGNYGAPMFLGSTVRAMLSPANALEIDSKIDDSRPASGYVRSYKSTSASGIGCTSSDLSTAAYLATTTTPKCVLIFLLAL